MAFFKWKTDYSVGVRELDEQHKKLIEILNRFFEAMTLGKGELAFQEILSELIQYTQFHFSTEETYMRKHQYPDLEGHCKKHRAMTKKVLDFKAAYEQGQEKLSTGLANFLRDWLQKHILLTDKSYSSFFKDKGLS